VATLFFSYSHVDEDLRDQLETHLSGLRRQGIISSWHDRRITAGEDFGAAIDSQINAANVILLLVSPDFIASDYCYEREMKRALERHQQGDARVIPVILRPCDWHDLPFGKLLTTPKDGRPITMWPNRSGIPGCCNRNQKRAEGSRKNREGQRAKTFNNRREEHVLRVNPVQCSNRN
jgi:hypothetical protein